MARRAWIAGALAALTLAGCGAADERPGTRTPAAPVTPARALTAPAPTDGRVGPATAATDDGGTIQLSRGGRPDVTGRDEQEPRAGVGAGAACPGPELDPVAETLPAVL